MKFYKLFFAAAFLFQTAWTNTNAQSCIGDSLTVQWQIWDNVDHYGLEALAHEHAFPQSPDRLFYLNQASTGINYGDRMAGKIRGYIKAPETGPYVFNLTGDDQSILFLSTDTFSINVQQIALVPGWCGRDEHDKYPDDQTSDTIYLQANEFYFFEAIYQEGTGGDHVNVYWKLPSTIDTTETWNVIFGNYIYEALCETDCPVKNTPCDDGIPSTTNDKEDGFCNCFGEATLPVCVGERGVVQALYYDTIPGILLDDLYNDADYPLQPNRSEFLTRLAGPNVNNDSYGTRIQVMLYAPVTGDYQFNVTGDNEVSLKLSTDTDPANAVEIAFTPQVWGVNEFNHDEEPEQTSALIPLVKGNYYYLEFNHKEQMYGDHYIVFWKTPFFTDDQWRFLDATYLYSYACEMACIPEGTPCDDGDPNTGSDAYDNNCTCVGIPCEDESCSNTFDYVPYDECAVTDNHSTSELDAWLSCLPSPNPNSFRGVTHWIQYDFGEAYTLQNSQIWNYNVAGSTQMGFQNVVIDYSVDGTYWIQLGIYNWEEATGISAYNGFTMPDFNGIIARYVLFTSLNNFEDSECMGISEISFAASPCPLAGTVCDDENPETSNDTYNVYCTCEGNPAVENECDDIALLLNNNPTNTGNYDAAETIESAGVIPQGSHVNYVAGISITLNNDFEVRPGAEFLAEIIPCVDQSGTASGFTIPEENNETENTWLKVDSKDGNTIQQIQYQIHKTTPVQLGIYNKKGTLVLSLANGKKQKGIYEKQIPTNKLSAGLYLVKLQTEDDALVKRLMVVK